MEMILTSDMIMRKETMKLRDYTYVKNNYQRKKALLSKRVDCPLLPSQLLRVYSLIWFCFLC